MDEKRAKRLQIIERVLSLLGAGGLGYFALNRVDYGAVVAMGLVFSMAVGKMILHDISRRDNSRRKGRGR
jgi:hypothetical protein